MSLTKLDDRDPSVKLGSGWARPADAPQFDGTVTLSRVPGSSLTIEFTGTSISVFGSILGKTTPTSTYVIDNGGPTLFALESQNPKTQFSQNFFQSDELPFGNHTLLVTNKGDWFYFDYFVLKTLNSSPVSQPPTNPAPPNPPPTNPLPPNPPPPNLPPSNPPPNLQPPTTQSSQTVTSTFLNQTILTSQAETSLQVTQSFSPSVVTITVYTSTSTQNIFSGPPNPTLSALVTSPADTNATVTRVSRLSAGAIAGIVVGIVIAAATILVLLYCCYHRRKARNRTSGLNSLRGGNLFASSPETRLVPFDGQQAARSFPRSRKNNNNSIDYVVPIETEQQRVSSGDPFREVEHGNFRI